MLVQDYVSAVGSLEKACKLYAEAYGETANECGESYLSYGKALLELFRLETGVLGHALQGGKRVLINWGWRSKSKHLTSLSC